MTKQEEMREELAKEFYNARASVGDMPWGQAQAVRTIGADLAYAKATEILEYLHSQGVVIKVERELPKPEIYINCWAQSGYALCQYHIEEAGYEAVEPLIKEVKG